jgi:LacI family gluconate utilization system Gnt-I transcriptional repressor
MADIAAFVGVTKMRSREYCDTPNGCAPETRDLVQRIVNEIGYVTNRLAGSLTVGCSGLVGAIVPTLRHSLFRRHDRRDDRRARRSGDSLIVANSRHQSDTEESQIRAMLERRPDAFVLTGLRHTPEARRLIEDAGVPVVETWECADAPNDMPVGYSNREVTRAMTLALSRAAIARSS